MELACWSEPIGSSGWRLLLESDRSRHMTWRRSARRSRTSPGELVEEAVTVSTSVPVPNESEAYIFLLYGHLLRFIARLREIPPDRWEWQPALSAPSPRILATHAWQWLVCDRQHITEPDATRHSRVPDAPPEQQALCDLLEEEAEWWRGLLQRLTREEFLQPRWRWNWSGPVNLRWLVCHMTGNVIYKHGQLATLYFALGLDGREPYVPPLPNDLYDQLEDMRSYPVIRAVVDNDLEELGRLVAEGGEVDATDKKGMNALHYAASMGNADAIRTLLAAGADVHARYRHGYTALMDAAVNGKTDVVSLLLTCGADLHAKDRDGNTALRWAEKAGYTEIAERLRQAGSR
jgi:hypothetical protein